MISIVQCKSIERAGESYSHQNLFSLENWILINEEFLIKARRKNKVLLIQCFVNEFRMKNNQLRHYVKDLRKENLFSYEQSILKLEIMEHRKNWSGLKIQICLKSSQRKWKESILWKLAREEEMSAVLKITNSNVYWISHIIIDEQNFQTLVQLSLIGN